MASNKDHIANIKTVQKWEKEFNLSFDYDIAGINLLYANIGNTE